MDIKNIMFLTQAEARQVMQALRNYFGKSKRDVVTIEEFCSFTGISKNIVRMSLVAREIEHELRRKWRTQEITAL